MNLVRIAVAVEIAAFFDRISRQLARQQRLLGYVVRAFDERGHRERIVGHAGRRLRHCNAFDGVRRAPSGQVCRTECLGFEGARVHRTRQRTVVRRAKPGSELQA